MQFVVKWLFCGVCIRTDEKKINFFFFLEFIKVSIFMGGLFISSYFMIL